MDLGPHASFIVASYAMAALVYSCSVPPAASQVPPVRAAEP